MGFGSGCEGRCIFPSVRFMAKTGVQKSGLHGKDNKFDAADLLIAILAEKAPL